MDRWILDWLSGFWQEGAKVEGRIERIFTLFLSGLSLEPSTTGYEDESLGFLDSL